MKWLDEFKVALVSENFEKILYLTDNYPLKMSLQEMQDTLPLLNSAVLLFENKKIELNIEMQKVLKAKKYSF